MGRGGYFLSCPIYVATAIHSGYTCNCRINQGVNEKKMIDRIFKNKKTTVLGLITIAVSFVFVWFEKATLTEVSVFLTGGFAMLFMRDPKPKEQ